MREQPKTIAILGANALVENALAQLLAGEGYSTRVLKTSSMAEALVGERAPAGGVDLVVLAPSLSTTECEAFLAARRTSPQGTTTTKSSPTPVLVLRSPTEEAPAVLEEDDEAVRSVPWPTMRERLVREIKEALHEVYLPPGYYLDHSDPEVLALRRAEGEVVARFSAPGYVA